MVVLMGAMEPQADAKELGMKCGISCGMAGWYTERHPKLDPVATMTDGVFVAGVCQGPKDIPASVAQGAAAAARVAGMISKGEVMIEPIVASIDEEECSGCRICNNMCPYNAIEFDEEKKVSRVDQRVVQGLRHLRRRLPRRCHHRTRTSTTSKSSPKSTGFCGTRKPSRRVNPQRYKGCQQPAISFPLFRS